MNSSFRKNKSGRQLIVLGLVMWSVLLVLTLRRPDPNQPAGSGSGPLLNEIQRPIFHSADEGNVAADAMEMTAPTQSMAGLTVTVVDVAIEATSDPDRGSEALERAVESVSDAELPARIAALASDASARAAEIRLLLTERWAQHDPVAAAAWASGLNNSPSSRALLKQVAVGWGNTDLNAAASWVRVLPPGDNKQAATFGLAYEAARTDPVIALDLASTLLPTPERDNLLVHAVSQWAATDSSAATTWTMKVPEPVLRQRLLASAAIALAHQDAVAAVALVARDVAAGDVQDRAAVSIAQRWAQQSPQTAASWVTQFPDIPSREAAVQNVVSIWAAQDAQGAGRWVGELPQGHLREAGIAAYARVTPPARSAPQPSSPPEEGENPLNKLAP